MQTQEAASTVSSNLLRLPGELRILILRQLLLCTPYISYSGPYDLHVQVLRANKQLYSEGLEILYGENYFRMKIFEDRTPEGAVYFVKCNQFGHQFAEQIKNNLPRFKLIQHYDIYVEIRNVGDEYSIKPAVRNVANLLSEIPRIKHLRITLGGDEENCNLEASSEEVYLCSPVLELFTLLRGVHRVDFIGGIKPNYAENFKKTMEGNSPLDHLPKMYDALEDLAGPFEECQHDLMWACEVMENNDAKQFKFIRGNLSQYVVQRIQDALNHLTDHGAEPDEEGEWVIERRPRRKKQERYSLERVDLGSRRPRH